MKNKSRLSIKHIQIDRENATMLIIVGIAAALTVFCLVASKSLLSQSGYHNKVISERKKAKAKIEENVNNLQKLVTQYRLFASTDRDKNILGASQKVDLTNVNTRSGDNAKIVLDALPSKYDFPALATSIEKILVDGNYSNTAISGTDDEVNQNAGASANPAPVEIPFSVTASSSYDSVKNLVSSFEASIRPIQILSMSISGSDTNSRISIQAKTFYQPEKVIKIDTKVVK